MNFNSKHRLIVKPNKYANIFLGLSMHRELLNHYLANNSFQRGLSSLFGGVRITTVTVHVKTLFLYILLNVGLQILYSVCPLLTLIVYKTS